MQKVYTKIESIVGNVVTVRASGVRNGDLALVGDSYANVIKLDKDLVTLQVFSGTQGVSTTDPVRFLGRPMMVSFSDHLLGRIFDGAGVPRDNGPALTENMIPIGGPSVNPSRRIVPNKLIRTGIPMIDVFNTLVESQKLPIFSVSGEPYNQLLSRIAMQAQVDVIVLGGMGLKYDDYLYFRDTLEKSGTRFVNSLVYASVGILGAFVAIAGGITVGELSVFLNYANQYTKPFNDISDVMTELQNALACAQRVFDLIDETPITPDAPDAVSLPHGAGSVAFEHVRFRYQDDVPLIEDMNLKVEPGQRIALVGPTGCGKTTLVNLLMRFYEINSGTLRVDGHPIDTVTRDSLRANLGMVLQETWLKAGTIAENIAYGKPDATREEIIAAAKKARAHSFICRLPNGYDTQVAEDGGNISQGQRQLLCIARVMLRRPPILILDDSVSAVDTRTEKIILDNLKTTRAGKTTLLIAHRISTVEGMDKIVFLEDGRVEAVGTHDALYHSCPEYRRMVDLQRLEDETADSSDAVGTSDIADSVDAPEHALESVEKCEGGASHD